MAQPAYGTSSLLIGYALCSSLLAIINKFAITKFSYPGLLTALQYLTSVAGRSLDARQDRAPAPRSLQPPHRQEVRAGRSRLLPRHIHQHPTSSSMPTSTRTFIVFRSLTPAAGRHCRHRLQEAVMPIQAHVSAPRDHLGRRCWLRDDGFGLHLHCLATRGQLLT
ncbi:hypothetical protein GUJ93_ZPchr0010g10834 [Zizania palustris]|uniref:Uncharacterized protein n=1 Tax=Zizania palustris TaxID=103762 RepID=A0A8J6BHA7_ZIZPA|nr:hypothetical protein GUJ93_ZPchr0010g10834 [Zizania palustris]